MDERFTARRLLYAAAAALVVVAGGTIGFHQIIGESWLDAFYRAVVTSSLTGLDTVPRSDAARLLSVLLVFAGLTIFAFVATILVEAIAQGVIGGAVAERRRRRAIENLHDHYIICGYGRVGRRAAEEFREAGASYVVLDFSEDAIEEARERGDLVVVGNGTDDDDLHKAGLEHARGLLASADSDADNLYITVSARAARPDLTIVTRASTEAAARKLKLAGADRVVQPYSTAGREMANLVLKPQVAAFLDAATTLGGPELRFEEIEVNDTCGQAGKTIGEVGVRDRTGAVIVALRKRDGEFDATPSPDARLDSGDLMIAVGTPDELRALEELFAPREAVAR